MLDLCGYIAAIFCELMKNMARDNRRVVAALDLFVCIFIILSVTCGSVFVWDAAVARLLGVGKGNGHLDGSTERALGFQSVWQDILSPHGHHDATTDVDGRLVFVFALSSMLVNGLLGITGYYYVKTAHGSWWDWAHSILHPGCVTVHHQIAASHHQHGPGCDCTPQEARAAPINLNVTVMWVHVMCDAVKDCVLLVVSFLMMLQVVSSRAADAASAIAVVCLVIAGSFWIFPAVWIRVKQVFCGAELTLDDEDEEQTLLLPERSEKLTAAFHEKR